MTLLHGGIIHAGAFHRKEGKTATVEEFIAYFRERLVANKVSSEVEFRSDLPKSMIGKILRRQLREEKISRQ